MAKSKSLIKFIDGTKFVFIRTRTFTQLFNGVHISYRWIFGVDGDPCHNTARSAKTVRRMLSYITGDMK